MNIYALLARDDKAQVLEYLEDIFELDLEHIATESWGQHFTGYDDWSGPEWRILVYSKNGGTLIYGYLRDLLGDSYADAEACFLDAFPKSARFWGSETSMAFEFIFCESGRRVSSDYYEFDTEFTLRGKNILGLGEHDDIIYDGFFPLVDEYLSGTDESDQVEIYRVRLKARPAAPPPSVKSLTDELQYRNSAESVQDGYRSMMALYDLQKRIIQLSPGRYSLDEAHLQRDKPDLAAYMKMKLWHCALAWERPDLSTDEHRKHAKARFDTTVVLIMKGIDFEREAFGDLYAAARTIINRTAEPDPYRKFNDLKALMGACIRLGYLFNSRHAEKRFDESFRRPLLREAHKHAAIWKRGGFHDSDYKRRLLQIAHYLAWGEVLLKPRPWWQLW